MYRRQVEDAVRAAPPPQAAARRSSAPPRRPRRRRPARSFPSNRVSAISSNHYSSSFSVRNFATQEHNQFLQVLSGLRLIIRTRSRSHPMPPFTVCRRMLAALSLVVAASAGSAPAVALDKVTFGTNWVAEGEHGGFYQAVADGTYKKFGLDVTILPGGPNANNRMLLLVDKLDFYLSANTLQGFDAVENTIPTVEVAAMFQKDPQVLIAHPDQGIDKFEDLKKLTLFVSKEGLASYFQWLKSDYGFSEKRVKPYTSNPQPFL